MKFNVLMRQCANVLINIRGVSHFVLKGSDASHQGSLAALEGRFLMC
jgi:hypothetical protein